MKMQLNKLLLVPAIVLSVLFLCLLTLVIQVNYSDNIPVERALNAEEPFNIYPHLRNLDVNQLKETFPFQIYLDSAHWTDIKEINAVLCAMDSSYPNNEMGNQEVLSIALTEKLEAHLSKSFEGYQPDSLIRILQWAERFNNYAAIDEIHSPLFEVVYTYWFNSISNALRENAEKNYAIKYDYKFRYIAERLREKQFSTPVKGTYIEKTIYRLIDKNWAYLFNKFWYATSVLYKLVIFSLVAILIFPYIYILKMKQK